MDFQIFENSLGRAEPPADLPPPLRALWHQAKGNWDKALELAQGENSQAAAWVHAFLHRVEGDEANAEYWYDIAGRSPGVNSLSSEWREIVGQLLEATVEPAFEMDH